uniref:ABC transporter ATP-binding protein n=1 Tax=Algoriphagus sp. TaxID=1872435 RepID=UPI004048A35D
MVKKILILLTVKQKKEGSLLFFLLLIGIVLELLGIGLIIPAITVLIDYDNIINYNYFKTIFKILGNPSQNTLIVYGLIFLVFIYFIKTIYLIYLSHRQSRFIMYLSADFSNRLFLGYLRLPYFFHLNRNSSELLRNIQTEVNQFTTLSQGFLLAISELAVLLSVLVLLIFIEPIGALSVSIFLGGTTLIFYLLTKKKILEWGEKRQFYDGEANKFLIEGLTGVKEIKFSSSEFFFHDKFKEISFNKANVYTNQNTLLQVPRFYLELIGLIGLSFLIIVSLFQNKDLTSIFPVIGLFVAAAFRLIPSANRIINSLQVVRTSKPVINLLFREFQYINANNLDFQKNQVGVILNKDINLKNITFSYGYEFGNSLENFNFKVNVGQVIGIIGSSGSGKSTLIDIILGLLDPTKGQVLVDGVDICNSKISWRKNIGYVPQNIFLLDDTLGNNIAFGIDQNHINKDFLIDSIEAAQIGPFVESLPEKISTIVGERGVRLSGGQKQRIGIARALYRKPSVLILDEATSALDSATENEVMNSIYNLKNKITIIIVAHRISTLADCDKIIKIENGVISQVGSFTDFK